jgi:hypothetical protein
MEEHRALKEFGAGSLQRQILTNLKGEDSYVSYHALRWRIADDRRGITRTGLLCPGIETGYTKGSFEYNFKRAVERLREAGHIKVNGHKLVDLDEALNYFPCYTRRLEIHQLRKKLLPSIAEYVHDLHELSPYTDIEKRELSKLSQMHPQKFIDATEKWKDIQKNILAMLKQRQTDMYDDWLLCLVRGCHLFLKNRMGHPKLLMTFCDNLNSEQENTEIEKATVGQLRTLIDLVFNKQTWELKNAYYEIVHFMKGGRVGLELEVKTYLRERHKNLVISLPGHEEVEDTAYSDMDRTRYSGYLDKLLTRSVLGKFTSLKAL